MSDSEASQADWRRLTAFLRSVIVLNQGKSKSAGHSSGVQSVIYAQGLSESEVERL